MTAVAIEPYSDANFSLNFAASPQRSRTRSETIALRRISNSSMLNSADELKFYDQFQELYLMTNITEKNLSLQNDTDLFEEKTIKVKPKRYSFFRSNDEAKVIKEESEIKNLDSKRLSIFSSFKKIFSFKSNSPKIKISKRAKVGNTKSKSKCLYDEDDGLIDISDTILDISLNEGGIPFELANSHLKTTYINSLKKLQFKEHRPLVQLLHIHTMVNNLQPHVNNRAGLPLTSFSLPELPAHRTKPKVKRLTSISEPDLNSNKNIFSTPLASRSTESLF